MIKKHTVLMGVFLSLVGCGKKTVDVPPLATFPVQATVVVRQPLEDVLSLVGSVKAKDEAVLYSRVAGKLVENLVEEGDRVQRDQPVALVRRDEVGVHYQPAPVPSTLTGVVGRVYLDRGAEVALNTPVALVVDNSQMLVRADVPERYAGQLALGQKVRVSVESGPNDWMTGVLERLSPVVDTNTRGVSIDVLIKRPPPTLRSGMFATLNLVTVSHPNALVVPGSSLLEEEGDVRVFVVENDRVRRRSITVGLRTLAGVEVLSGLQEGDRVVSFGLFGLEDGSPVSIQNEK